MISLVGLDAGSDLLAPGQLKPPAWGCEKKTSWSVNIWRHSY